ncbi:hypothetical protein [Cyclobacterium roseum]|uniref:hypothetical protein n=1 Tax=Cyclobacterium roseum TaxID=2666137 RepID=UPI001390C091|nr:hypothetical protein [Cyclobacterium roseum]
MDKIVKLFVLVVFLMAQPYRIQGQEISVEGYFMEDSARLGERVGYVLKAQYPSDLPVLFPDSTYRFGDFELLEKQSFSSISDDSTTLDSAVFWLANFSLDSVQNYRIPVFEILKYDSISHYPEAALLNLKLTIDEIPESLAFRQNDSYQHLPSFFNYPYLIMALVAALILLAGAIYFFGDGLKKRWQVRREKKKWKRFLDNWELSMKRLVENPQIQEADELLGLWKSYLETLTGRPVNEWTSTEISIFLRQPDIIKDFRKIELIIYANRVDSNIREACENLLQISKRQLEEKIEKIQHHE